jgi:hypothetical protein
MPLKQHPTDPDKMVYESRKYDFEAMPRAWAKLIQGVRVDGDTVVIKVKNGNDAARELCGALIEEINK